MQLTTNKNSGILVQGRRIKKNKNCSDYYADGTTLCNPEIGEIIHTARAVRIEMSKQEVTAADVRNASTLTLLRIRARNISFVYERLCHFHVDGDKVSFLYDSKEMDGDGDGDSRLKGMRFCVAQYICGWSRTFVPRLNAHGGRKPR